VAATQSGPRRAGRGHAQLSAGAGIDNHQSYTSPVRPVDRLLDRLPDARRNGEGFTARCPAHPDRTPSLSIAEGDDGRALVHCHAGCDHADVLAALDLGAEDLFPDRKSTDKPVIAETYPYVDSDGEDLFEVVRMSPKGFRQRRPDGRGGWVWNLKGVESRPLYRLPEVLAAVAAGRLVWITEGEKDADRLQRELPEGEVATTCPGGAGKWRDEHTAALTGAGVMVVADRDDPGRAHARDVARALDGVAEVVTVVEPVEGKDASDHVAAGNGPDDFVPLELAESPAVRVPGHPDGPEPKAVSVPTLDPKAFQGLAGEVVQTLTPHTEADPAGLLATFLTMFGNAAGAGPHARVGSKAHPARLNCVNVGDTARGRKGQGLADTRQLFALADPGWDDANIASGLSSGEGVIHRVRDADGDDPGVSDKRLLVIEEEWAKVAKVTQRDGNIVSTVLRQCWDSGTIQTLTRTNPIKATGAHVSVLGHITADELRKVLTETEAANGFANRHLFVYVRRAQLLPHGGQLPDAEVDRLGQRIRRALEHSRRFQRIQRTPEADRLWEDLYARMAEDEPPGMVGYITARAEAQTLRLSLVYALADSSPTIGLEHLEAAWALWSYCQATAELIWGDSTGDEVADRLLAGLREAGAEGLTGTEQRALFSRHVSGTRLDTARQLLESQKLAHTVKVETDGRPRTVTVATSAESAISAQSPNPSSAKSASSANGDR